MDRSHEGMYNVLFVRILLSTAVFYFNDFVYVNWVWLIFGATTIRCGILVCFIRGIRFFLAFSFAFATSASLYKGDGRTAAPVARLRLAMQKFLPTSLGGLRNLAGQKFL